jgi:hypothetical protein
VTISTPPRTKSCTLNGEIIKRGSTTDHYGRGARAKRAHPLYIHSFIQHTKWVNIIHLSEIISKIFNRTDWNISSSRYTVVYGGTLGTLATVHPFFVMWGFSFLSNNAYLRLGSQFFLKNEPVMLARGWGGASSLEFLETTLSPKYLYTFNRNSYKAIFCQIKSKISIPT